MLDRPLSLTNERFPDNGAVIVRLYREYDEFRRLCHDYVSCADAIQRMRDGPVAEIGTVREYHALQQQSLDAVRRFLCTHDCRYGPAGQPSHPPGCCFGPRHERICLC